MITHIGIRNAMPFVPQHVLPNSLPISNAFALISTVFFGTRHFTASRSDSGLSGIDNDAAPSITTFCESGLLLLQLFYLRQAGRGNVFSKLL